MENQPFITVLTPCYNGAAHLAECIESVLAQTYRNFEYIIINNRSADETGEIAERYAKLDPRIKVYHNDTLLEVIASHNRAFRLMSPNSKYCKVVSGDDTIVPECLASMVAVFEANPSVGIVGSHQLSGGPEGTRVKWARRPTPYEDAEVTPGHALCRAHFFGAHYMFGSPTSLMYRADLVRREERFYPNATSEADTSACCRCLLETDFGFVPKVLSYERVHEGRISSRSESLNAYLSSEISDLLTYGRTVLTPRELEGTLQGMLRSYYRYLAISALKRRERSFWTYHRRRMREIGHPLNVVRLAGAVLALSWNTLRSPKRLARRFSQRSVATE